MVAGWEERETRGLVAGVGWCRGSTSGFGDFFVGGRGVLFNAGCGFEGLFEGLWMVPFVVFCRGWEFGVLHFSDGGRD